jgi:hypothetical protein
MKPPNAAALIRRYPALHLIDQNIREENAGVKISQTWSAVILSKTFSRYVKFFAGRGDRILTLRIESDTSKALGARLIFATQAAQV